MKVDKEPSEISIAGEHHVDLCRQRLWESMNDPVILQKCIKGCEQVRRGSDDEFLAKFRFRVGPLNKTFHARLDIKDAKPPDVYRLVWAMDAGIAGKVNGVADVKLDELGARKSKLQYQARVTISGWVGELGIKVLGNTAQRYMQRFFGRIIDVLEENGQAL